MRELKFRTWDKKRKCYAKHIITTNTSCPYHDRMNMSKGVMTFAKWVLRRYVIEQYTGLKDKNGKEIYEGDIIQEEIDFNSKMTDGVFTYIVEWDNDTLSYGLRGSGNSIHDELWEVNASVEIVGNIHENQDLLGDTNATNKERE